MNSIVEWMLDSVLRPKRATYDKDDTLWVIECEDKTYFRRDADFRTHRGVQIHGGTWFDKEGQNPSCCIIYNHSLGMNQYECTNIIPFLCSPDIAVFSMDFSGCGISGGDEIPLLGNGPDDVLSAVEYLKEEYHFEKWVLWGRSMGAAISLTTICMSDLFTCIIADSSFYSTVDIALYQAMAQGYPQFVVKMITPYFKKVARRRVKENFDMDYPKKYVENAKIPLFMGHGRKDNFVPLYQAQRLYELYGFQEKQMTHFDCNHNSSRPSWWYENAAHFIFNKIGINQPVRPYARTFRQANLHIGSRDFILRTLNIVDERLDQHNNRERNINDQVNKSAEESQVISLSRHSSISIEEFQQMQKDN